MPGRPRKVSWGKAGKEYGSGPNGMVMGETWMPLRAKSWSYWNTAVSLPSSSSTAPMACPQRCTEALVLIAGSVRAGGFAVLRPCGQLCTISQGANGLSSSPTVRHRGLSRQRAPAVSSELTDCRSNRLFGIQLTMQHDEVFAPPPVLVATALDRQMDRPDEADED